jgi:hypothetical protein
MNMTSRIKSAAAIGAITWLGIATPATASNQAHQYGEHTGSVVFAETLGDAAKRVGDERQPAPHANVDIRRAQFTQTDGRLTLDLDLRNLRPATVDKLVVSIDTDGDAQPDQLLVWNAGDASARLTDVVADASTSTNSRSTALVACADADIRLNYQHDRIHVVIDRDCLPVVQGSEPGHPATPELHANVEHLQAKVYDRVGTSDASGRTVHAKWDFLGGRSSMVAVPF